MYVIGILMDPIESVNFKTDSSIGIIKSLQKKAHIKLILPDTIFTESNCVYAKVSDFYIDSLNQRKYVLSNKKVINLNQLDCILFRKDPPVDHHYLTLVQIIKELEYQNTLVLNSPASLLKFNEKLLGYQLSSPKIPTVIGDNQKKILDFLVKHKEVVLKPTNLMAGSGIIKLKYNKHAHILVNQYIKKYKIIIAQKYLKEIKNGDNRIIIYNGIIEKNVLTRFPAKGDFRANLACGGSYEITRLNNKYFPLLNEVASFLKYYGIFFAGVDMIGKYITEINITSPTGVQQIRNRLSTKISNELLKVINKYHES
jgi:glutathione synthase